MTTQLCKALAILALAFSTSAGAGEFWGVVNLASHHIGASKQMREVNPGLGIEYAQSRDIKYMAGAYRNSHSRTSVYGLAAYTPVHYHGFSLGVAAGAVNGYPKGRETTTKAILAGLLRWRGDKFGVNLMIVPKSPSAQATLGLQAVFKF